MSAILGMTRKKLKSSKKKWRTTNIVQLQLKKISPPRSCNHGNRGGENSRDESEHIYIKDYLDSEVGAHTLGYISEISQAQLPKYRRRDKFNYKLGDLSPVRNRGVF